MDRLPEEISNLIGDQIDLETARSLSRVSKNVRQIGEKRVWQDIDLTEASRNQADFVDGELLPSVSSVIGENC